VLRQAGLSDSAVGTPQTIYRYSGRDNVLTYGNVPPAVMPGTDRRR
jgi:hypothetical protein